MKFFVILLALLALAYLILRPLLKTNKTSKSEGIEEMQECACCGVYVSVNESFLSNGRYFCSKECLQKGAK